MDNEHNLFAGKVGAILIALGSASFVVTIYHLIILCRYHQHHHVTNRTSQQQQQQLEQEQRMAQNALELPQLIPSHKYEKKKKNNGDEDDMCAVCLGDFEEGEELRTLPECIHTFHGPCIDPWLYSHSSCPVCRTLATPSPAVVLHSSEYGSGGELNARQHTTVDIVQIPVVQNRLAIGQILI